jgi:hypothetical protein
VRLDHITLKRFSSHDLLATERYLKTNPNSEVDATRLETANISNSGHRYRVVLRTALPGDNSEQEPPEPIPNSEVKLLSADDSVGFTMRK